MTIRIPGFLASAAVAGLLVAASIQPASADLRYRPQNPSFGGNPVNGTYLFNMATAQNDNESTPGYTPYQQDPLESFKSNLTSRLLNTMSNQLVEAMYGENAQQSGTYQIDDMLISFERVNGQLIVDVTDGNGGHTTIQLPILQGQ